MNQIGGSQYRKDQTMTNNTVLYTDEAFFNFALSRYYRSEPDHFTFSKLLTDLNMEVVGSLKQAPVLDLSYTGDNENFLVTFPEIRIMAYDFTNGRRGQALTEVSLHQLRFSEAGTEWRQVQSHFPGGLAGRG
jgi:hypothetical protein